MPSPRLIPVSTFIIFLILLLLITPALAGERYSSGEPALAAGIAGSNELRIGEKTDLAVTISNSGVYTMKSIEEGSITPDYLPTTALSLSAHLDGGDSPVTITSDPQILGDLTSGNVAQATFPVTVPDKAVAGTYEIPLTLSYRYMDGATQTGTDDIQYTFRNEEKTILLPITLRPAVRLEIRSVDSGDLNVGGEGHIVVMVENTGTDNGKETVFTLEPVGYNPITPLQDSIYIGDFPEGKTATLPFKVSVADKADPSVRYPLTLQATYTDYQGLTAGTSPAELSAGFKQKVTFEVVTEPDSVSPGGKDVIEVGYRNTGSVPVYNAQAGINIVDPFTSVDDQSYLGTILPGETANARFKLNVNSGTTVKQYGLDSEIRYTDSNQTSFTSDPIKVPVNVTDGGNSMLLFGGILLVIILIGGGFFYYRRMQQS